MDNIRKESDSFGEIDVPSKRYYGAGTARSLKYFNIAYHQMPREMIEALLLIKEAAAIVNNRSGLIDDKLSRAIIEASKSAKEDRHRLDFPLSLWQTGSGTQTNMNVNEVVANIANESLGSALGSKKPIHPNDHVNMSQSSNDVFPTAMHIATVKLLVDELLPALAVLRKELDIKAKEFSSIIKIGRTHLMDAVPLTLGQEFSAYVDQIDQDIHRIKVVLDGLYPLAIGGTAVGTGLNAPKNFGEDVAKLIAEKLSLPFTSAKNKFQALASKDPFVFASGALKTIASTFMKIANDIRLLGSGPRCGFNELILPSNEPGSSIMPGKVNPTQCEAMTMAAVQVIGNDTTIAIAASQSNFQLNVYMPVIFYNIVESITLLSDVSHSFTDHLVKGLKPNKKKMAQNLANSLMLVTSLVPHIGYDKAAQAAKLAHAEDLSLKEACLKLGLLKDDEFDSYVRPENMV